MNKLLFSGLALGFYVFSTAQSMQSSEKGRDLLLQMEQSLETYYGHEMKLTPSYEKGSVNMRITTTNPNRFYFEPYRINEALYVLLALDRPFNYTTWKAEK